MKLSIGENIRKRRRSANMTQEQLAQALGVSVQSVSRWETGATYPDVELIPTVATVFDCTVDELFHSTEEEKRRYSEELREQLNQAMSADNEAAIITALQKIRRSIREDYCWYGFDAIYYLLFMHHWDRRSGDVLAELRLLTEEILRYSVRQKTPDDRFTAVEWMAKMEDEAHIEEFLNAHAGGENSSRTALLLSRYLSREDAERFNEIRQFRLWSMLTELLEDFRLWDGFHLGRSNNSDPAAVIRRNELNFAYLHEICGKVCDPKHPVTGDGSVDLWCVTLIQRGFELAGAKKRIGDEEGAFLVLEDIVSLLEKIMAIREDRFRLSCASPFFTGFHADAAFCVSRAPDSPQRALKLKIRDRYFLLLPSNCLLLYKIFVFDSDVKTDPRYDEYYRRIGATIGQKDPQEVPEV